MLTEFYFAITNHFALNFYKMLRLLYYVLKMQNHDVFSVLFFLCSKYMTFQFPSLKNLMNVLHIFNFCHNLVHGSPSDNLLWLTNMKESLPFTDQISISLTNVLASIFITPPV